MSLSPADMLKKKVEAFHFLYISVKPCGRSEMDSILDQLRRLRSQVEELCGFPDISQEAAGLIVEIDSAITEMESAENWHINRPKFPFA